MKQRPYILTIAGFDPSGGAGLVADVKTFEALKCQGLSVCTANTVQNDIAFEACHWVDVEVIKSQVSILFDRFEINFVKIGIVENWKVLSEIVDLLVEKNPKIKIILDPVLKSSSNFEFHTSDDKEMDSLLSKLFLITPNYDEIQQLYANKAIDEVIAHISKSTNLYLKGGHNEEAVGKDHLYLTNGKHFIFNPKEKNISEKHGSGCVLSSAIAAHLARQFPIMKACFRGKRYVEKVMSSNKTLLGYHG